MSVNDPIYVPIKKQQEAESLRKVEQVLSPWICTWVDQRDDYGRDGFIQIVDDLNNEYGTISPLTFAIQVKSCKTGFESSHKNSLETRHIGLWSHDLALPTVVCVWSKADNVIRWRTARNIATELNTLNPRWREQARVSVEFRKEHSFEDDESTRETIRKKVADEQDRFGGSTSFHKIRRRVILTDLYAGRITSTTTLTFGPNNSLRAVLGTGWAKEDLHPIDVDASRVLAAALFLFEEIWISFELCPSILNVLEPDYFVKLLQSNTLVLYKSFDFPFFLFSSGDVRGETGIMTPQEDPKSYLIRRANEFSNPFQSSAYLADNLVRYTKFIDKKVAEITLSESRRDLADNSIRELLGFGAAYANGVEPIWDARLVNRLFHINSAMAIADTQELDVVELETGLSRIASEKWFSKIGFHHFYPTSDAFDSVLRNTGAPDTGLLVKTLGLHSCVDIATSRSGETFREWFWETASDLVSSGADISSSFESMFNSILKVDIRSLKLPCELRLRFFQKIGQDYLIGSPIRSKGIGMSTRVYNAKARLNHQLKNHIALRHKSIKEYKGRDFGRNEPCPCQSGRKYKHCCGGGFQPIS